MRKSRYDTTVTQAVMRGLEDAAKEHGVPLVRYVATKWANGQRDKARLLKQRAALEKQLTEVSKKLRR